MESPEVLSRKRNVVLYLDPHLVREAKDRGINLSRFLEYDLRLFLSRMKHSNLEYAKGITGETESASAQNDPQRDGRAGWCGGWDSRTSLPVKVLKKRIFWASCGRPNYLHRTLGDSSSQVVPSCFLNPVSNLKLCDFHFLEPAVFCGVPHNPDTSITSYNVEIIPV